MLRTALVLATALLAGCVAVPGLTGPADGRRGGYRIKGQAAGHGPVFLAGSGDHPPGQVQRFRNLAGGDGAVIAVGPFAGGAPAALEAAVAFRALGPGEVALMDGQDAGTDAALLARADGIYFVGGSAEIAARKLDAYAPLLRAAWRAGAAIGGTSAGAMVWGDQLVVKGETRQALTRGVGEAEGGLEVKTGLGFATGMMIDPHFSERARFGRLWVAAGATGLVGIGVDENTAAVWTPADHKLTAYGSGSVTVVRHDGEDKGRSARVAVIADGRMVDLADWDVPRP